MTVDRARALRGQVRHFRRVYRSRWGPPTDRDAVGKIGWQIGDSKGTCLWCGQPTDSRRRWHEECVRQYQAARGLVKWDGYLVPGAPSMGAGRCESCGGPADEVDHRIALAVARALGYRAHIRSHLLDNLRWLCRDCHRDKTAADLRTLATIRAARRMEAAVAAVPGLLALPDPTPAQGRLF